MKANGGDTELERVPRKVLKKDMDCPICGNPFLEGVPSRSSICPTHI